MKGSTKAPLALFSVGLGALAFAALPASASTGTVMISGSGSITPGLVLPPATQAQSFTFSGSGTAATDTYVGAFSCNVTGNDTVGNIAQGQGSLSGTCTAGSTTETVTGNYKRDGNVVELRASIGPGPVSGYFDGACNFEPTDNPPQHYNVQCWLEW